MLMLTARLPTIRSHYNWLDLLAFIFPLVASIVQLVNIKEGNPDRAVWLVSFSLVIVFFHMVQKVTRSSEAMTRHPLPCFLTQTIIFTF